MLSLSKTTRPVAFVATAGIGLALFGGGVAFAAGQFNPVRSDGTIHACMSNSTNVVRILQAGHACHNDETPFTFNQRGRTGASGARGADGADGAAGAQGPAGSHGADGAAGQAGPQGSPGARGADGAAGPTGARGGDGAAGAQGPAGARGANGADGAVGAQGATGAQGSQGPSGAQGAQGPAGAQGTNGADAKYVGAHWGVIDRNVIGNGNADLRSGPYSNGQQPPLGQGSLGLRTGSGSDATSFGNEIDFRDQPVSNLSQVGFSVFRTNEDASIAADNMPGIAIEVDPNSGIPNAPRYTTLKFLPKGTAGNSWSSIDATSSEAGSWGLTGSYYANTPCAINGSRCSFATAKALLGQNAKILTIAVSKGRDWAFSGAVDALRINDTTYDFEPFGVYARAAS